MLQNLNFLTDVAYSVGLFTYSYGLSWCTWVVNRCRRCRRPRYNLEDYLPMCKAGNLLAVRDIYELRCIDLISLTNPDKYYSLMNSALGVAVGGNNVDVARFLIEKGANNLDECLKVACANDHCAMAEMLIQKGANTLVGKRVARPGNLLRMIYRYEQKSEVIN